MPDLTFQLLFQVAASVIGAGLLWFLERIHRDLEAFLTAIAEADERSRQNAAVLDDLDLLEQSDVDHMREERRGDRTCYNELD